MDALVRTILGTDFFNQLHGENPLADPVAKFLDRAQRTELNKYAPGIREERWSAEVPTAAKSFTNPLNFDKSAVGFHLGIVRITTEIVDGERWSNGYDANDQCVASRIITG